MKIFTDWLIGVDSEVYAAIKAFAHCCSLHPKIEFEEAVTISKASLPFLQ